MARTHEVITNEEGLIYHQWCQKYGVIADDDSNAEVVARYFQETWQQDVTEANLDSAFPLLKSHLKFCTLSEAAYQKLTAKMTEAEKQIVTQWFTRQRLVQDGDLGFQNKENLVSWLKEKNMEVSGRNLDLALSNIIKKGHYGHPILAWKSVEVKKQEREVSDAEIATWRSRAEGVVVRTPSGLVINGKTEEVRKIVVNGEDGKIDWRLTAQARELAASRKM
jgi:hypothetical protein